MGMSDPLGIIAQGMGTGRICPRETGLRCRTRARHFHPTIQMDFSFTVFRMGNMESAWEKETRLWHGHH
jgi:hypothetical protein